MKTRFAFVLRVAFVAAVCPGCSSTYQPRLSPRIAIVQEAGKPMLVKGDKRYDIGIFGGGLVEAVAGVPLAEEYAESFRNRTIGGLAMNLGGVVVTMSGAVLMGAGFSNGAGSPDRSVIALTGSTMVVSGLGLMIAGLILGVGAPPRMWDAINAHNDAVSPVFYPMPNWGPPPGFRLPPAAPAPLAPLAPAPAPPAAQ
jgi:hypothetical protein